ncbi:transmembrane protein 62-like [Phlebotomus argentipes]|uniref:transmembrane protein 62-like n=1 Tax=Phlebotomus argentipes TaxID=94469 RepID=UPI0028935F96|nr:transmembrane protein 62-like [Phlebotomus argentipes]
MGFTKSAVLFLILIIICSVFVANVSNLINASGNVARSGPEEGYAREARQSGARIGNNTDHLMWFLQISDLHISMFRDEERIRNLGDFMHRTISAVKPTVVVVSGDLTDARSLNHLGSEQFEGEWKIYKKLLQEHNVTSKTAWLDLRGNHDNFNVAGRNSSSNFFHKYSVQGSAHSRSYMHQVEKAGDKYTFLAVDACLEPGPKRPYNFIGMLTADEVHNIERLMEEARRTGSKYTVWFGHYPTSCILTAGAGIRDVIGRHEEGLVYLCGHLHTMGGMVKRMYTLQNAGFLELELGDWKDNRLFRLAAIDHGMFSFVDVHHNEWPIVLVTNPKDATFNNPLREDIRLQVESTHIRLLAFSVAPIVECRIRVDSEPFGVCDRAGEGVFVAKWEPVRYRDGLHHVEVLVKDADGREKSVRQAFSLDGTSISFAMKARFVLMTEACNIFQAFFGTTLVLCLLPLIIFRVWHMAVVRGRAKRPRIQWSFVRCWVRRLWLLSSVNRLFYPLLVFFIYLLVGPWSVADVIDGHFGVVFMWGILVDGVLLPGSLTYLYGFFQIALCQLPLTYVYASILDRRYRHTISPPTRPKGRFRKCLQHLPFLTIITVELILMYFHWASYGFLALILGPLRTWSLILNFTLWYQAQYMPDKCLHAGSAVWSTQPKLVKDDN